MQNFKKKCASERESALTKFKNHVQTQARLFDECIKANAETQFGKEHGFSKIKSIVDFRSAVPIREYSQLAPWIDRVAAGEKTVLTADEPFMFFSTSGTSGASKLIPGTKDWVIRFRSAGLYSAWGNFFNSHPEVTEPDEILDLNFDPRPVSQYTKGGIPCQGATQRSLYVGEGDWHVPWRMEPWFSAPAEMKDYGERMYLRLRHFISRNLKAIVTINPSTLVILAHNLNQRKADLIRDLHNGSSGPSPISANPKRAREIESLLRVNDVLLPKHVWPNLTAVMCWKAASAALYLPQVRELFGDKIDIVPHLTVASEGCFSVPTEAKGSGGTLAVNHCLFEFVRGDQKVTAETPTLDYSQLERGEEYQLIITQSSGLYRYSVGDMVRVLEIRDGVPYIEFLGRAGNASSFTGEKLTEIQIVTAVTRALELTGTKAAQFACFPTWGSPPFYRFVIELESGKASVDQSKLLGNLEKQIGVHNDEYSGKVTSGRLGKAQLTLVSEGTFRRHWESLVAKGASAAQIKPKILHKDDSALSPLLQFHQEAR